MPAQFFPLTNRSSFMNKMISIAAIVALFTTLSSAQDMKFGGIRAAFHLNSVTTGNGKYIDEDYGIGLGGSAGLVSIIPTSGDFAARIGVEFVYRTLYDMKLLGGDKQSASEFALSIPAMVQYTIERVWLGVGVQSDFPFATEIHIAGNHSEFKDRSVVDFGIIIGLGYNLSSNIVFDIRSTIVGLALTNLSSGGDDNSSLYQGIVGLTYLF